MQNYKYFIKKTVVSAMFLAIGIILPSVTMQIPDIGNALLPMHIPVLLCGFVCGWQYGLAVGVMTPLLRSLWYGMPYLYPKAIGMAFELAAYGAIAGLMFMLLSRRKNIEAIYFSLLSAMIGGRLVWGAVSAVLYVPSLAASFTDKSLPAFTFKYFLSESVLLALPGIVLQFVLIPLIIQTLISAKIITPDGKLK